MDKIQEASNLTISVNKSTLTVEKVRENSGDLNGLTAVERKMYYIQMCDFYKFYWKAFPFDYIENDGKLKLYVNQTGCSHLRNRYQVSTKIKSREIIEGMWVITVEARRGNRTEEATGAASLFDKYGKTTPQLKANSLKKAETQARRRATLAICGFSDNDEDQGFVLKAETYDPPMDIVEFSEIVETISEDKQRELWAIAKEKGVSQDQVREIINDYGYIRTNEIETKHYEKIIASLNKTR